VTEILFERVRHTAVITLNRPESGNALTRAMRPAITGIWADVMADDDIRAVVITGAGDRHFCTGVDVEDVAGAGGSTAGMGPAEDEIVWSPLNHGVWKPVICALNGLVAGGGLHFVADADIVLAAPHVSIMDTHTSVGMVGAVENVGLTHRLPLGSVLRMTLLGRHYRMSADRAYQLGLVDEVCEPDRLLPIALDMGDAIAQNSPAANRLSKQAIWGSIGRAKADAEEYAWALARMHRSHPDYAEGSKAFVEKRAPHWRS
jgi:enoyl-CoA hydratase/carnithine racemase